MFIVQGGLPTWFWSMLDMILVLMCGSLVSQLDG